MIEIRAVNDWIAVYKDGELVHEGHDCPLHIGLEALGIDHAYAYRDSFEDDLNGAYNWLAEPNRAASSD